MLYALCVSIALLVIGGLIFWRAQRSVKKSIPAFAKLERAAKSTRNPEDMMTAMMSALSETSMDEMMTGVSQVMIGRKSFVTKLIAGSVLCLLGVVGLLVCFGAWIVSLIGG